MLAYPVHKRQSPHKLEPCVGMFFAPMEQTFCIICPLAFYHFSASLSTAFSKIHPRHSLSVVSGVCVRFQFLPCAAPLGFGGGNYSVFICRVRSYQVLAHVRVPASGAAAPFVTPSVALIFVGASPSLNSS